MFLVVLDAAAGGGVDFGVGFPPQHLPAEPWEHGNRTTVPREIVL